MITACAHMLRKSANNLHSTVSNGFPHGGVTASLHNQADKRFDSFLPSLVFGVFLERGRQVRVHKTGSPAHIVTFSVARVFLCPPYENTAFFMEPSVALLL